MGTFTAGGFKASISDGELSIEQEGRTKKFVDGEVEHVTFSGEYAQKGEQKILYITERCVFELTPDGVELIEVAPGVDVQKDVIDLMGFTPIVTDRLKKMDSKIFKDALMGL